MRTNPARDGKFRGRCWHGGDKRLGKWIASAIRLAEGSQFLM
jgi:hypothetical protein